MEVKTIRELVFFGACYDLDKVAKSYGKKFLPELMFDMFVGFDAQEWEPGILTVGEPPHLIRMFFPDGLIQIGGEESSSPETLEEFIFMYRFARVAVPGLPLLTWKPWAAYNIGLIAPVVPTGQSVGIHTTTPPEVTA